MNKHFKKSLCICATALLIGGMMPGISNQQVSAHRRYRTSHYSRINRHKQRSYRHKRNRISYRTYKYNLRKYNQVNTLINKDRRKLNYYKRMLRHRHSKRLTRRYNRSKRYWNTLITRLSRSAKRYRNVISQYKAGKSNRSYHRNNRKSGRSYKNRRSIKLHRKSVKQNVRKIVPRHNAIHNSKSSPANNNDEYVLSTNDMLSNNDLYNLQNDNGYTYGGGSLGDLVNIVDQKNIDGKTFDYIKDPSGYDNDKWIYDGELSTNPNASASNINLNNFEKDIHSNYINTNKDLFLQQMKEESLNFINHARNNRGLNSLIENPRMDQLANLRAHQLVHRYSHYTPNGQPYAEVDAPRFNISMSPGWGENIAYDPVTHRGTEATDPNTYDEYDGNGMAYAANNNMLNWDSHSNWGHRHNMLNPNSDLIGIGSTYDPSSQYFFLAEDFYNHPSIIPDNNADNNSNPVNYNSDNGNNDNRTVTNVNDDQPRTGNANTINSTSRGAVILHGNANTVNAKGAVIINGNINTVNARGVVIDNGSNNTINSGTKIIYNDKNTNDRNYQKALSHGVAVNASNMNDQTILK